MTPPNNTSVTSKRFARLGGSSHIDELGGGAQHHKTSISRFDMPDMFWAEAYPATPSKGLGNDLGKDTDQTVPGATLDWQGVIDSLDAWKAETEATHSAACRIELGRLSVDVAVWGHLQVAPTTGPMRGWDSLPLGKTLVMELVFSAPVAKVSFNVTSVQPGESVHVSGCDHSGDRAKVKLTPIQPQRGDTVGFTPAEALLLTVEGPVARIAVTREFDDGIQDLDLRQAFSDIVFEMDAALCNQARPDKVAPTGYGTTDHSSDAPAAPLPDFFEIEKVIERVVPCFTPGTLIATPTGERRVEDLAVGDRVITRDNGIQKIRWVGRRDLSTHELQAAPHLQPVRIAQGALGNNLPERDMLLSPNHRVLITSDRAAQVFDDSEVLISALHLTYMAGIAQRPVSRVSYIHFMFDQHEVVLSDGSWTESFQPMDRTLSSMERDQRDEIYEIFPELCSAQGFSEYPSARRTLSKEEAELLQ